MPHNAETDLRILDPDGYKDRVRQMWRKRAPNYDFQNDFHPQLCERLVAIARVQPGKFNLLDVASGTGTVALSAARALGPEGIVTAVDISKAMLAKVFLKVGIYCPADTSYHASTCRTTRLWVSLALQIACSPHTTVVRAIPWFPWMPDCRSLCRHRGRQLMQGFL